MAKKTKFDRVIVRREVDSNGFVRSYDKNDCPCWDKDEPERVVLICDIRAYSSGLHIGQLGWTVPGTTDSYKWIDVVFDNGVQLPIVRHGIQRVIPERADAIAADMLKKNRNTRFDADPVVAERCRREWIKQEYADWVDTDQTVELSIGPEEVYAFSFPSLQELARLKGATHYPVKIGCSSNQDAGAVHRIRGLMTELAGYPERPVLLSVYRTWDGRALEQLIHAEFRRCERRLAIAPGREWFNTNQSEVAELCTRFGPNVSKPALKPLSGAGLYLNDLSNLVHDLGGQVELIDSPDTACIGIRITQPKPDEGTL
jgi:hypothetical protein